jgi:hypothetical protein
MTDRVTTPAAYSTAGICAMFGSLTANEMAAYGGLFLGLLTFLTNAWFQWDRRRREVEANKPR